MSTPDTSPRMSTEPFVWVIIPLVAIFTAASIGLYIWNRQKRRRNPDAQAEAGRAPGGSSNTRRGRFTLWSEPRPAEGLNELGEAPPPYNPAKPPEIHEEHATRPDETAEEGTELRDMDAGHLPPAYPALPPPAVTAETRAS